MILYILSLARSRFFDFRPRGNLLENSNGRECFESVDLIAR